MFISTHENIFRFLFYYDAYLNTRKTFSVFFCFLTMLISSMNLPETYTHNANYPGAPCSRTWHPTTDISQRQNPDSSLLNTLKTIRNYRNNWTMTNRKHFVGQHVFDTSRILRTFDVDFDFQHRRLHFKFDVVEFHTRVLSSTSSCDGDTRRCFPDIRCKWFRLCCSTFDLRGWISSLGFDVSIAMFNALVSELFSMCSKGRVLVLLLVGVWLGTIVLDHGALG